MELTRRMRNCGVCVVFLASVLLQVYGSQDCRNMKKILTTCEAQFHQNMSGNFTADCSSGAVQGYGDCLGDAVGCTDVADATERMLNYEYGYTANQEEDEELEKRQLGNRGRPGRIQCRFHCYPRCSCCPLRCRGFKCVLKCRFKRDTDETNACEIATQSFQEVTGSSVSAIKPVIAITASIVAAAAYSLS